MNLLLCLILSVLFTKAYSLAEEQKFSDKTEDDIWFVGRINGKSFFAVNATSELTWPEAGEACRRMGMQLAELTTLQEGDLVASFFQAGRIGCCRYWIGGRDARELRQFNWDTSKEDLAKSELEIVNFDGDSISCLTFDVQTKFLNIQQCIIRDTSYRLCEFSS